MVAFVIIGLALIDSKWGGRRSYLLAATCIMGPPLRIAATAVSLDWTLYLILLMVCLYGGGFQLAWDMVPWIYPAEIFSMAEKETAVSLAVFLNYLFNGLIVYITSILMGRSTPGTFYMEKKHVAFLGSNNVLEKDSMKDLVVKGSFYVQVIDTKN